MVVERARCNSEGDGCGCSWDVDFEMLPFSAMVVWSLLSCAGSVSMRHPGIAKPRLVCSAAVREEGGGRPWRRYMTAWM